MSDLTLLLTAEPSDDVRRATIEAWRQGDAITMADPTGKRRRITADEAAKRGLEAILTDQPHLIEVYEQGGSPALIEAIKALGR